MNQDITGVTTYYKSIVDPLRPDYRKTITIRSNYPNTGTQMLIMASMADNEHSMSKFMIPRSVLVESSGPN
jgi:hypothetical protein